MLASTGEHLHTQVKLPSLASHSPPAVRPGSLQATGQYLSAAYALGTPGIGDWELGMAVMGTIFSLG